MIAFLVNPCIETTTAWKKPAYLEDDRMTPDTGRYSWKKHPKTLNANHLSIRCCNQQPWAHGFFLLVRNPNQKMYMWMFQVSNLISSWWTKSYTCSHRLIPQWSYNYFWMVSRTSPSQSPGKKFEKLFRHARRFGQISQEASDKHHWLVSWLLRERLSRQRDRIF